MMRHCFVAVLMLVTVAPIARAEFTILPPTATVAGRSIADWTGDWFNWVYNFPAADGDPILDSTGALAGRYQSGPVFFIAGTYGEVGVVREFEVPSGVHILVPLVNAFTVNIDNPLAPDPSDVDLVRAWMDDVGDLTFSLNSVSGGTTAELKAYRQDIIFNYNATVPNSYDFPLGVWPNFIDGYWIMLAPLAPGNYTMQFGGTLPSEDFEVGVTANFKVTEPTPAPASLLVLGVASLGLLAGRRFCRLNRLQAVSASQLDSVDVSRG